MTARGCSILALSLALLPAAARGQEPTPPEEPLGRAYRFLWSQQAPDGGWHSETYAILRSGQALTPFVLRALLDAPASIAPPPTDGAERALAFVRERVDAEGRLGLAGQVLEYPTYATAYALRCLVRVGAAGDQELIGRMARSLVGGQYTPERGFPPAALAHGGWGFGGTLPPGDPGHMDLSHTRAALEALAAADALDPTARARAQELLRLLQKDPGTRGRQPPIRGQARATGALRSDGGFYFTPVALPANKGQHEPAAGERPAVWRSYATATADGLLALLAAGVDPSDPRVARARAWLWERPALDRPAGVPTDQPVPWSDGIHYYHLAVRAEAYRQVGGPDGWRARLLNTIAAAQRADGSFRNASGLMKEDDPLLCTALAAIALRAALAEG